jgi:hypothetical protein
VQKLLVLKKLEEWMVAVEPSLSKFPKSARFTLAQKIENASLDCIDKVIAANLDKPRRGEHLLQARVTTERVQLLIRVARSRSFIDMNHYELYSEKLTEISKMLAGWARATNKS